MPGVLFVAVGDRHGGRYAGSRAVAIDSGIIEDVQLMNVELDVDVLDGKSGLLVNIERSNNGHIAAVDSVNLEIFRHSLSEALQIIR